MVMGVSRIFKINKNKKLNIMIKFNKLTGENTQEHNSYQLRIPEHPYRILIVGGSGSEKTNSFLNLIYHQENDNFIDKIFLRTKDPYKLKCQFVIEKREEVGLKHLKDPKAVMEYSNEINSVYSSIE